MQRSFRRGITPAIATMFLITATLVLALVFGAYSSSLFRSNLNGIQLEAGLLYDGYTTDNITSSSTANLVLTLKNPDVATNLTSLKITSPALTTPITSWSVTPSSESNNSLFVDGHNLVAAGTTTGFNLYPVQSPPIDLVTGSSYEYYIQFSNGQTISGSLVVQ